MVTIKHTRDSIEKLEQEREQFKQQHGMTIEECLQYAYDEISQRKGRTINGTFIKESDLNGEL